MAGSSACTEEFRVETADRIISTGRPAVHAAEEPGPNPKAAGGWAERRKGELAGDAPGKAGPDEARAARKRIRELETGNGFPREASAFLAGSQAQGAGAHRCWSKKANAPSP